VELACRRKSGEAFSVAATFSRVMSPRGELAMVSLQDISDQKKLMSDLGASRTLIRELAARNEAARELERKHIARDVHDELGQVLTALRMDILMARRDYQTLTPEIGGKLTDMCTLVDRAIAEIRSIAGSLRPSALDMGLHPAIDWLCEEFASRAKIPCELNVDEPGLELAELRAVVLDRIIQESLTNISKYAQARAVEVSVARIGDLVHVLVRDDGVGFDVPAALLRKTYGLVGMQERALVLEGSLRVNSAPGCGTRIEVTFPYLQAQPGVLS
jgi:signal transduction histidine kinase